MSAISFSCLDGSREAFSTGLLASSFFESLLLFADCLSGLFSILYFCFWALSLQGGPMLSAGNNRETMPGDSASGMVGSLSLPPAHATATASVPNKLDPTVQTAILRMAPSHERTAEKA